MRNPSARVGLLREAPTAKLSWDVVVYEGDRDSQIHFGVTVASYAKRSDAAEHVRRLRAAMKSAPDSASDEAAGGESS